MLIGRLSLGDNGLTAERLKFACGLSLPFQSFTLGDFKPLTYRLLLALGQLFASLNIRSQKLQY